MEIDAYFTPYFPEKETQFDDAIVIMIDVLRASTTICASLYNGAKEVIPSETLDRAVKLYSSLSKETRFIGGERNGIMPTGFDAGNSPFEYTEEMVKDKTVIISTTNGTQIFQKAKQAKARIIAGFVNNKSVLNYIDLNIKQGAEAATKIIVLCAGNSGRLAYEDTLCAGSVINSLKSMNNNVYLTDTADAAKNLYNLHSIDYKDFLEKAARYVF
ncbi:MAG: 2-phosphosulfolactate phosphatase, partial [Bacteroidota bacterium]